MATPVTLVDVLTMVEQSFQRAKSKQIEGKTPGQRSQLFVEELGYSLRRFYPRPEFRVLNRQDCTSRDEFGLNEMLHDVCVVRVEFVDAPRMKKRQLPRIIEALWQIESEFGFGTKGIVLDFNKLVLGSSKNKLFITSERSGRVISNDELRNYLLPIARNCSGSVFIALVPHPQRWENAHVHEIEVWQLDSENWVR
jgi:hypothetical protein